MQELWVGDAEIWNRMGNYTRRTVAYISFFTIHNNFLVHLCIVWCPLWHSSLFKDMKSRLLSIEVQGKTPASSLEVKQNPHFHFPHGKCTGIICHICSSEDRPFSFCQVKRFWERPFMNYIAVYGKLILNHWSILILFFLKAAKCWCLCMNLFMTLLSLLTWLIIGLVKILEAFLMSQKSKYYVLSNLHVVNEGILVEFSAFY